MRKGRLMGFDLLWLRYRLVRGVVQRTGTLGCLAACGLLLIACQRQSNKPVGSRPATSAIDEPGCAELRQAFLLGESEGRQKEPPTLFLDKAAKLGDRAVPCLRVLISDESLSESRRVKAVFALAAVNTTTSVDCLVRLMSGDLDAHSDELRQQAAHVLEAMVRRTMRSADELRAWPGLLGGATSLLDSEDRLQDLWAAANLIVRIEGPDSERVRRLLADHRPAVRKAIEEAIGAYAEDLARSATKPAAATKPGNM